MGEAIFFFLTKNISHIFHNNMSLYRNHLHRNLFIRNLFSQQITRSYGKRAWENETGAKKQDHSKFGAGTAAKKNLNQRKMKQAQSLEEVRNRLKKEREAKAKKNDVEEIEGRLVLLAYKELEAERIHKLEKEKLYAKYGGKERYYQLLQKSQKQQEKDVDKLGTKRRRR